MRRPRRFDARQHVTLGPAGMLPPCTVTVHRVGNWAQKKTKTQERLKCSMKMTYHWSTGYEEIILDVGGASLAV